ncbi:MAG TPA: DUF4199 domain-containing protein [Chitinophagaceae bacterium]
MEQTKPVSHFVAGLIIAAILIVYSLILNFTGQGQNQSLGWVAYLLFIGALIYFITQYGKSVNYSASFGKLFGYGFKITAIVTLIILLFTMIFFSVFPEYKEQIMEAMRTEMDKQVDSGKIQESQADTFIDTYESRFLLLTGAGIIFGYLVIGAIGSLIGAAVTKKNPQSPFDQQVA